jgi:hypothetical protein
VSLGEGVLLLFETGQCRVLISGEEEAQLSPWGEVEQRQAR